jgi:hypothetical protein
MNRKLVIIGRSSSLPRSHCGGARAEPTAETATPLAARRSSRYEAPAADTRPSTFARMIDTIEGHAAARGQVIDAEVCPSEGRDSVASREPPRTTTTGTTAASFDGLVARPYRSSRAGQIAGPVTSRSPTSPIRHPEAAPRREADRHRTSAGKPITRPWAARIDDARDHGRWHRRVRRSPPGAPDRAWTDGKARTYQ